MNNILFISLNNVLNKSSGGSIVTQRNHEVLTSIAKNLDKKFFTISKEDIFIKKTSARFIFNLLYNLLNSNVLRIRKDFYELLTKQILENNIKFIFIDTTLLGNTICYLNKKFPNIYIITYAHNVELVSSIYNFRLSPSFKNLYNLYSYYFNEKRSVRYSNDLITISNIDANKFLTIYKRIPNLIIPVTIKKSNNCIFPKRKQSTFVKLLFIGSDFPPNIQGIFHFVKNILPFLNAELIIAGSGMGKYAEKFNQLSNKLRVFDYIEDLSVLYNNCDCVIAPIFSGSGMKVKIAESIMFGKVVFGTPKAFEGYCSDFPDIFIECNEDEDFIYQINNFDYSLGNIYKKGQLALEIFRNTYSNDNNNKYFLPILNTLKSK